MRSTFVGVQCPYLLNDNPLRGGSPWERHMDCKVVMMELGDGGIKDQVNIGKSK
jgi:hypothetical protein